jgi:hypothetical protein
MHWMPSNKADLGRIMKTSSTLDTSRGERKAERKKQKLKKTQRLKRHKRLKNRR